MFGRQGLQIGALPLGLLGAVALAIAVEGALARHTLDFATTPCFQYRATADALYQARDAELVCFGDSLIKLGVLPRLIGQNTGLPAYNLALLGSQPMSGYFLLRRALNQGMRPKAILVGFSANMLECDPRAATRGLEEIVRPAEVLDFARTAHDSRLFGSMALASAVTSYRCRLDIRANVMKALRGEMATSRWANLVHRRNWTVNRGSQVSPPTLVAASPLGPEGKADRPAVWSVHPVNAVYVKRFLQLAESRGIAVYWLLPPIRPDVQARMERLGLDALHTRFVHKLQAAFPRMVVVDGRHAGYAGNLFSDPIHLHRLGATAYSEGLAEALSPRPGVPTGPRWVNLPPYREPHVGAAVVEDIAQTLQALRTPSKRLR